MKWADNAGERKFLKLRLYDKSEGNAPCLKFEPLKLSDKPDCNPMPEDWSCCSEPLIVYFEDYRRLLKSYFALMFPTILICKQHIDFFCVNAVSRGSGFINITTAN